LILCTFPPVPCDRHHAVSGATTVRIGAREPTSND